MSGDDETARRKAQRSRSVLLALALLGFAVLVYLVTVAQLKGG